MASPAIRSRMSSRRGNEPARSAAKAKRQPSALSTCATASWGRMSAMPQPTRRMSPATVAASIFHTSTPNMAIPMTSRLLSSVFIAPGASGHQPENHPEDVRADGRAPQEPLQTPDGGEKEHEVDEVPAGDAFVDPLT